MIESLKGKLTEEEARELFSNNRPCSNGSGCIVVPGKDFQSRNCIECEIKTTKKNGYIKQNPVEKAEELFEKWENDKGCNEDYIIRKQNEAIQHLKKQLEEK